MGAGNSEEDLGGRPDPDSVLTMPREFLRRFYRENEGAGPLEEGTGQVARA